jgi:2-phosphoglycerate kinase
MVTVIKKDKQFPFSEGIMAKSITGSGLSTEEAYEIVRKIRHELRSRDVQEISSDKLRYFVSRELLHRGHPANERYYRVRRQIKYLEEPIFILIGGAPGVGKSTVAAEIGHKLGIDRVIGSDTVREIMRSIISRNLIPALHESSFNACEKIKGPDVKDRLIYGYKQQIEVVSEGIMAVMRRGYKEGLSMVLSGVHIVPGFVPNSAEDFGGHVSQYVIAVHDTEQLRRHFFMREENSSRDPKRYVDRLDRIERIQDFICDMAAGQGVKVVDNVELDRTTTCILEDVISQLEFEVKS